MSNTNILDINRVMLNCCELRKEGDSFIFISPNKSERMHYCKFLENNLQFHIENRDLEVLQLQSLISLRVIVILCQGIDDYIETLSPKQQLAWLLGECDVNVHDRTSIHFAFAILSDLIAQVPVFVLHYTTPEQSAELLCDYLHKQIENDS